MMDRTKSPDLLVGILRTCNKFRSSNVSMACDVNASRSRTHNTTQLNPTHAIFAYIFAYMKVPASPDVLVGILRAGNKF